MSDYTAALRRLRDLVLAQNVIAQCVKAATEEVLALASSESPTLPDPRSQSQTRLVQRAQTKMAMRKVGSVEVENHIRSEWSKAADEPSRTKVLEMIGTCLETGVLDLDARERICQLTVGNQ